MLDAPLAARFALALLIVLIVLGLIFAVVSWLIRRRIIRRFVIHTAEILATLSVLASAIGGGYSGMVTANLLSKLASGNALAYNPPPIIGIFGFVVGALFGFVLSAIMLAILFLLTEIAENSRKTVSFFEHMSSGRGG
jgi:hypothetical protein